MNDKQLQLTVHIEKLIKKIQTAISNAHELHEDDGDVYVYIKIIEKAFNEYMHQSMMLKIARLR